ncbi:hypothetical protein Ancab_025762 [Ancistrocladus abbreviatus]
MPGLEVDGGAQFVDSASIISASLLQFKRSFSHNVSPRSPLSAQSPGSESIDLAIDDGVDDSIEQLYRNICEMQSSDQSPSMRSFTTFGNESRIDAELSRLVGRDQIDKVEEVFEEEVMEQQRGAGKGKPNAKSKKQGKIIKGRPTKAKSFPSKTAASQSQLQSRALQRPTEKSKSNWEKPPTGKRDIKFSRRSSSSSSPGEEKNLKTADTIEPKSDNPDLGPYLLKKARGTISSGDNPKKALEYALRAKESFEKCSKWKPNLDYVMCLHVVASIYCSLGKLNEAIPLLERSLEIPKLDLGEKHALAKFSGCMQLGDVYAMLGQIENSLMFYVAALEIQRQVLGEKDAQFGETCRYLAEAYIQALQFEEAEKLCQMALDIHKENGSPMSIEGAADRRLMGLICDSKGNHKAALQHYVIASMIMSANGQEIDKAAIDCNIGDAYLSLARYDEAIFSYQKALTVFKLTKGENHPAVASVFVRLAELYNKVGKFRESKSYCENALWIYNNPPPGVPIEEIANGLINIAAIYESMQEVDQAIDLLQRALKIYNNRQGQLSTIAGIEAQMGVMNYMLGNYSDAYTLFKSAIAKFQACGEKKSAFYGIALNQMALTSVQLCAITEAADLFEEARIILEKEYGPYHPDTLGVCSNLAGTYDALGRWDDAIEILEFVVGVREEKLGTADPMVDDEKRRLAALLKEAGRKQSRKSHSLKALLDNNCHTIMKNSFDSIQF